MDRLEELLERAGEATQPPPGPNGGIPRQRAPGLIRWPLRVLFLPFVLIDLAMQKVARWLVPPPFKKVGSCKRRGNCCHYILLQHHRGWKGWLSFFWNTEINGFFLRDQRPYEYEGKRVLVMGCRYLQRDGSCGHYHLRPMVCRRWPVIEYFGQPQVLKGCGYKAIARDPAYEQLLQLGEKDEL